MDKTRLSDGSHWKPMSRLTCFLFEKKTVRPNQVQIELETLTAAISRIDRWSRPRVSLLFPSSCLLLSAYSFGLKTMAAWRNARRVIKKNNGRLFLPSRGAEFHRIHQDYSFTLAELSAPWSCVFFDHGQHMIVRYPDAPFAMHIIRKVNA